MAPKSSIQTAAGYARRYLAPLVLTVMASMSAERALCTDTYTVGQPTRNGRITLTVTVTKNGVTRDVKVTTAVDSTWTVLEKQLAILYATNEAKADTLIMHGYVPSGKITFEPQNNWKVDSVVVTGDTSCEPHVISMGIPRPYQEALCSLSGVASGNSLQGQIGAGAVRISVGGQDVVVPTQAGMPSTVVEQMLVARLNQVGIPARFATAQDFAGGYESLPHDAQVILFPVPDTTGIGQETTDSGLSLDLVGIINGNLAASVPDGVGGPDLWLDVHPSLFSSGPVLVRYAAGAGGGPIGIDVFDVAGRRVRTLIGGNPTQSGEIRWDGRDGADHRLSQGVYFVRLSTPQGNRVRRIVRLTN